MAHEQRLGRRFARPAHEIVHLELAVDGGRPDLEQVLPQEGDGVGAGEAGRGIGERPLEERGAEGHGEGVEVRSGPRRRHSAKASSQIWNTERGTLAASI